MYQEKGVKWWRVQENPNKRLPVLLRDIEVHAKAQKVLLWVIYLLITATFLLLIHLFTFKHKENIIISDGTLYGCMLNESDL